MRTLTVPSIRDQSTGVSTSSPGVNIVLPTRENGDTLICFLVYYLAGGIDIDDSSDGWIVLRTHSAGDFGDRHVMQVLHKISNGDDTLIYNNGAQPRFSCSVISSIKDAHQSTYYSNIDRYTNANTWGTLSNYNVIPVSPVQTYSICGIQTRFGNPYQGGWTSNIQNVGHPVEAHSNQLTVTSTPTTGGPTIATPRYDLDDKQYGVIAGVTFIAAPLPPPTQITIGVDNGLIASIDGSNNPDLIITD